MIDSIKSPDPSEALSSSVVNSQTMALLQADVSSVSVLQDRVEKYNDNQIKNDTLVEILSDNALLPKTSVMAMNNIANGVDIGEPYSDQISVYVVRKGDSISQIAEMFDVSINTILWTNDLKKQDVIKEGDVLFILPISGVEHIISKGETLTSIAKLYKADILDIAGFNGITENTKLTVGEKIIVPGGEIYNENAPSQVKSQYTSAPSATVNISGYFINPVPAYSRRSQGPHGPGKRGIDLAAPTGTPVLASAEGTVLLAREGWNGAYGNMVILIHPNGTKTLYAHLSKIKTATGAKVSRGELIGNVGSTGRSTGPHLHFEVFNAKNPGGTTPMSFATH